MKKIRPLELDVRRKIREIEEMAPPHRVSLCGPDYVRETAVLLAMQCTPAGLGYRETMRLLDHLHWLHMSPLGRAEARGPPRRRRR